MKRSLLEKIVLFILYVLALPFILLIYSVFIIIYVFIFVIEIWFYKNSRYFKDLHEKYYTFITFTVKYKKYNYFMKNGVKNNDCEYISYKKGNETLYLLTDYDLEFIKRADSKDTYFVIEKKLLNDSSYKELKRNLRYVIYDN